MAVSNKVDPASTPNIVPRSVETNCVISADAYRNRLQRPFSRIRLENTPAETQSVIFPGLAQRSQRAALSAPARDRFVEYSLPNSGKPQRLGRIHPGR